MALKIGITGGIGSGKSTVCKVFKLLGAPVFEADIIAKELYDTDPELKQSMIDLFGPDIYTPDAGIDRKKLAALIFNDELQLASVNALVHPAVRKEFEAWTARQNAPYVVHEAAILFESGFYKMMDFTVLVSAPENERIARVCRREESNEAQVRERMKKQWTDGEKRPLASIELKNGDRDLIIPAIVKMDKQLREYGKIW